MASTSDIKNGLCLKYNHDIYKVVEFLHVKPGKGPAFVRTKMKSLTNGKVVDNTFPAGHKIEVVRVERRKFQYLYSDDMGFNFMDNETFNQVTLDAALIDNHQFMKEGDTIDVLFNSENDTPLTADLPQYVIQKITYTEPGEKGNTATNAQKPAKIESGAEIRVPLFINEGDNVKIETSTGNYIERVKR